MELRKQRYDTTKKRFLKPELITICISKGIAISKDMQEINEGWVNQPKGMLQVLYERGYIDKQKVTHPRSMSYSKKGRKCHIDAEGELSETGKKFSLHHLLSNCINFLHEKSDLEHLCSDLSTSTSTVTVTLPQNSTAKLPVKESSMPRAWPKSTTNKSPTKKNRSFHQLVCSVKTSLSKVTLSTSRRFSQKSHVVYVGISSSTKRK